MKDYQYNREKPHAFESVRSILGRTVYERIFRTEKKDQQQDLFQIEHYKFNSLPTINI